MSSYSDYANAASAILLHQGDQAAQAARQRGALWGGTLANLGQIPAEFMQQQQHNQEFQARQQAQAQDQQLRSAELDIRRQQLAQRDDPAIAEERQLKSNQLRHELASRLLINTNKDNYDIHKPILEPILGTTLPDEYPGDETIKAWGLQGQSVKEQLDAREKALEAARKAEEAANKPKPEPKTREIETIENGVRVKKIVPDVPGTSFPVPDPTIPPGQAAAQAETARHNRVMEARPVGGSTAGQSDDVKVAVSAMKEGTVPPQLPGRASKEYLAVMAEAKRQGYDLAGAATDWMATQKHIATLNGSQQTRLNQAINQLPDLLDSVDSLSSKWKAGRFPILNKANLALAKGGAFGKDAASIANQLDAQIADVTADLGAVYMGGNSPTDHALGLAAKALDASWDEKVLHDMVTLARKNVQTRQNSIRNTGVQGASATNPYAPPQQPPPAAVPTGGAGLTYQDYLKAKGK